MCFPTALGKRYELICGVAAHSNVCLQVWSALMPPPPPPRGPCTLQNCIHPPKGQQKQLLSCILVQNTRRQNRVGPWRWCGGAVLKRVPDAPECAPPRPKYCSPFQTDRVVPLPYA